MAQKNTIFKSEWERVGCGMLPVLTSGFWLWKELGDAGLDRLFSPSFPATWFLSVGLTNSLFSKYATPVWQNGLLLTCEDQW